MSADHFFNNIRHVAPASVPLLLEGIGLSLSEARVDLEDLVDDDDREGEDHDDPPLVRREIRHLENLLEIGDGEDSNVLGHGENNGDDEVGVDPGRHLQQ